MTQSAVLLADLTLGARRLRCLRATNDWPGLTLLALLCAGFMATHGAGTLVFTDWQKADLAAQTVEGDLDGVRVVMSGGLISEAKLDSSSTVFNSDSFMPKLAKSDIIMLQFGPAIQTYVVRFSAPVLNPVVHLYSHGSVITFNTTNTTRLSGRKDFIARPGVVVGIWDGISKSDSEGSIRLDGVYSFFSFTAVYPHTSDGVGVQVGGTLVEGATTRLTAAGAMVLNFATEPSRIYQVQYSSGVPAKDWSSLGGLIVGDGQPRQVFDPVGSSERRFYRVLTLQ
jgi:hypothetical protein